MPKSIIFPWVQSVNNLRTQDSKTSAQLSPSRVYTYFVTKNKSVEVTSNPLFILSFTQLISTCKFIISDLLHTVYTHNPQHLLIEPLKKI